jgi:hypothetical protein
MFAGCPAFGLSGLADARGCACPASAASLPCVFSGRDVGQAGVPGAPLSVPGLAACVGPLSAPPVGFSPAGVPACMLFCAGMFVFRVRPACLVLACLAHECRNILLDSSLCIAGVFCGRGWCYITGTQEHVVQCLLACLLACFLLSLTALVRGPCFGPWDVHALLVLPCPAYSPGGMLARQGSLVRPCLCRGRLGVWVPGAPPRSGFAPAGVLACKFSCACILVFRVRPVCLVLACLVHECRTILLHSRLHYRCVLCKGLVLDYRYTGTCVVVAFCFDDSICVTNETNPKPHLNTDYVTASP